jgi:hypothetical protein
VNGLDDLMHTTEFFVCAAFQRSHYLAAQDGIEGRRRERREMQHHPRTTTIISCGSF